MSRRIMGLFAVMKVTLIKTPLLQYQSVLCNWFHFNLTPIMS